MTTDSTLKTPRPYYFSCRIRLTDEERLCLKDAYAAQRAMVEPVPKQQPGSYVTTVTQHSVVSNGIADITFRDLLSTRESISIGVILKIQAALGVNVVTEERIRKEFDNYLNVILSDNYVKAGAN